MTTDDFKPDGDRDSDSTQTPNQRFAAVVDDFISQLSKKDAKHPFIKSIIERRDQAAPEKLSESKYQEQQLRAFISDLTQDVAAKKKNSRSSRALDKLGPFVLSLTELAKFCETVFGASPMAVAAIFSGARMVLMLALNAQECFNTVIEAVDEIDTYLHCYDNFYDAYRDDPVMQSRLVASYRNILEFWWESIKILSNSVLKSIAKGLVAPLDKGIKDSLRAIKEDRSSVQCLAQSIEAKLNRQWRPDMLRDQIIPWIAGPEGPSQLDPRHSLYDMQELHHHGTCSWIFDHNVYKEWDGPGAWTGRKSDPVLWYNAPPGCGKSIMASQIVSHLKQENHKVVWYFCSFDDPIRRDPRNVLRSIAIQLLCRYVSKRIPDKVVDMFREDQSSYNNFINHESQLMAVVHELLKATSLTYIVVDGLDEILSLDQERPYPFHGMFGQLILRASERHGTTKWCFTSRDEGPVRETMEGVNALQVDPSSANLATDIKVYLKDRLAGKKLSPDRIEDLVEASEGNFLYAKLRADTLLGQGVTCEEEVEEELRTYPKGLSGCYLRSLEKLDHRTTYEQELARRTIVILVTTRKLLTMPELLDALATRIGCDDYSAKRIPSQDAIRQLCGSFLTIDCPTGGTECLAEGTQQTPIVKLSHKSVQDFFLLRHDLTPPDHLSKYFVTRSSAHREMGQMCLTYLNFKRYESADGLPETFETDPSHAFLRYASVFWFQHLDIRGVACEEMRQEVREFLKSGGFWTAFRVQTKVARYLFARYVQRGGCGYSMRADGSEWTASDFIASTIPLWWDKPGNGAVTQHDLEMLHHLQRFTMEWHEALASGMDVLLLCPIELAASGFFPGRAKFLENNIKRAALGPRAIESSTDVLVDEVCSGKGVLKARVLLKRPSDTGVDAVQWLVSTPFSKPGWLTESVKSPVDLQARHVGSFGSLPVVDPPGMYSICRRRLDVTVITAGGEKSHPVPKRLVNECLSDTRQGWQLVNEARFASDCAGNDSVVCHFAQVQKQSQSIVRLQGSAEGTGQQGSERSDNNPPEYDEPEEGEEFDEEFDEEEEDSESEAGSETEGDSGAIDSSTDATEPESDTVTDVLVVVCGNGNPVWIPCPGSQKSKRQIGGALHPSKPFFVWAQDADSLNTMNTVSGKTVTISLPELPKEDVPLSPQAQLAEKEQAQKLGTRFGSRLLTEVRFSSDGSLLHTITVRFEAASSHVTKATVALVTFRFETGNAATEEPTLEQYGDVLSVAYLFYKRVDDLPVPLGVVYWCADAVYVGLPLLTCSVKFIRMPLNASTSANSESQPRIQTIDCTILIPSSTSQRRPRMLYQSSMSKTKTDDSLYLVLGPEPTRVTPAEANCHYARDRGCSDQCDHEDIAAWPHKQDGFQRGGASVIRWNIAREGGWRDWDAEKDSMSDELKKNPSLCTFNELRGTFIDADKVFSVPIRGALNFTWKGYLSCG